ncbi:hypothetical protein M3Y96_00603000 [Aphelenchoides besseyi]|nr:hypothetical protein M3Y96_00603000 [Aphelenchoides besseyi]
MNSNRVDSYHNYSFELLDNRTRIRKDDIWVRFRIFYFIFLFLIFASVFGWKLSLKLFNFLHYNSPLLTQGCLCNEENFCFKSCNSSDNPKFGRPFSCALLPHLMRLNLSNLKTSNRSFRSIFVTTIRNGQMELMRDFVTSIRAVHRNTTILIYNLGLNEHQVNEISKWCNVVLQSLDANLFGGKLEEPLELDAIIQTSLNYNSFIFLDLRTRLLQSTKSLVANQTEEFIPLFLETQSNMSDNPNDYFPVSSSNTSHEKSIGFVLRNSKLPRSTLKWLFLCSRTDDCRKQLKSTRSLEFIDKIVQQTRQLNRFIPNNKQTEMRYHDLQITQRYFTLKKSVKVKTTSDLSCSLVM